MKDLPRDTYKVVVPELEIARDATFEPTSSCQRINGIIEMYIGQGLYLLHTGQVVHQDWFVSYLEEE